MRPWFPDEASAPGVQGDGGHTWDVLAPGSAVCCWGHKPDSCAYMRPLNTCTLSSSTGHSALVSILQGELWAGVLGVPSSAKVTGGSELRLLPASPGLLLTCALSVLPLQCRTATDGQRGVCWCVYPWSGERIPGSVEVRGDPNCNQYFAMHS